jgi:hypothetical protein
MSDYHENDLGYAAPLGHGDSIKPATRNEPGSYGVGHTLNKPNSEHRIQYAGEATAGEHHTPEPTSGERGSTGHSVASHNG